MSDNKTDDLFASIGVMGFCGLFGGIFLWIFISSYDGFIEALENDGETAGYFLGIIVICLLLFGFVWSLYKTIVQIKNAIREKSRAKPERPEGYDPIRGRANVNAIDEIEKKRRIDIF
jgi:ammonia channel protein AmtB